MLAAEASLKLRINQSMSLSSRISDPAAEFDFPEASNSAKVAAVDYSIHVVGYIRNLLTGFGIWPRSKLFNFAGAFLPNAST